MIYIEHWYCLFVSWLTFKCLCFSEGSGEEYIYDYEEVIIEKPVTTHKSTHPTSTTSTTSVATTTTTTTRPNTPTIPADEIQQSKDHQDSIPQPKQITYQPPGKKATLSRGATILFLTLWFRKMWQV